MSSKVYLTVDRKRNQIGRTTFHQYGKIAIYCLVSIVLPNIVSDSFSFIIISRYA